MGTARKIASHSSNLRANTSRTRPRKSDLQIAEPPPAPVATTRIFAVIDLGSRGLRLAIAEGALGKPLRRLETLSVPVSIGVDTFMRGRIRAVTMDAVVGTLQDFCGVLRDYGLSPKDCRVVATTAVRDAANREVFIDRIEKRTGLQVELIDAIEETRLVYQLMQHVLGPSFQRGINMLIALGAGGTHIIVQDKGAVVVAETRQFGMLNLLQRTQAETTAFSSARAFLKKATASLLRINQLPTIRWIVVVNSELCQLVDGLAQPKRDSAALHLRTSQFLQLAELIESLSADEIIARTDLDHAATEVVKMAVEEVLAFADMCQTTQISFPKSSMLDSLLLDAQLKLVPQQSDQAALAAQIEAAAWAIARKYRVQVNHTKKVQQLALQLFAELRAFTGLDDDARRLLSVAAILHDIGAFVSAHEHEEHSSYLIEASEILGLTSEDLARVAAIVRYHRRRAARLDGLSLDRWPSGQRVDLMKLIALLRLAESLDADHHQRIENVRVEVTTELMNVYAETRTGYREDFVEIHRAFSRKADLCEEIFGMKPKLIEVLTHG